MVSILSLTQETSSKNRTVFLGSLFFLLYVNDLHISSPKVKLLLFADDKCLFLSSKDINILKNDLNDSLKNMANWLKANSP